LRLLRRLLRWRLLLNLWLLQLLGLLLRGRLLQLLPRLLAGCCCP